LEGRIGARTSVYVSFRRSHNRGYSPIWWKMIYACARA